MNVFVLNTGRCGSTTFIEACRHITNYSAAHESKTGRLGPARLRFRRNHIEADNRLSWFLGRLDRTYGDAAFYVHLRRDPAAVAASYARRHRAGIMAAYRRGILMGVRPEVLPERVAEDYCETVTRNIECFLKDKSRQMDFHLETAKDDFRRFWQLIGAQGDLPAALAEFDIHHNAARARPEPRPPPPLPRRAIGKLRRVVGKLPRFLSEA
jgi:hypothetical protein